MKKFLLLISLFLTLALGFYLYSNGDFRFKSATAYTSGDLLIDWGVTPGNPIFNVSNMAPGDIEQHTVSIKNEAKNKRPVFVKGVTVSETGNLSDVLDLTISLNGTVLYGPTPLSEFLDKNNGNGVHITNQDPGTTKNYLFKVVFSTDAGNEYQGKQVVFDLTIISPGTIVTDKNTCLIQYNGKYSKNICTINTQNSSTTIQENTNIIINKIGSVSSTGNNSANNNSGGKDSAKSGNAGSTVNTTINTGKNIKK